MIGLGRPVVPEENRIHSGCPNGTCSKANSSAGTGGALTTSSQASAPGTNGWARSGSRYGRVTTWSRLSRAPAICRISAVRSNSFPP